jgi:hypothetical protein
MCSASHRRRSAPGARQVSCSTLQARTRSLACADTTTGAGPPADARARGGQVQVRLPVEVVPFLHREESRLRPGL